MTGMHTRMKPLMKPLILSLIIAAVGSVPGLAEDTYVKPGLLDLEQIRYEEQLSDNIRVERIYIFLAVWNGNQYDTYTTSGDADIDNDGETAASDINDLDEYHSDTYPIADKMQIEADDHTTYINGLPNFDEIFPDHDDPFADDTLVDVYTSAINEDENRLIGSKSIPVVSDMEEREGIEHFIAFYNKRGQTEEEGKSKNDVMSFGFIEIKMMEE